MTKPGQPYVRREIAPLAAIELTSEQIPETIEQAYALLRDECGADHGYGAAWKLGGTTETTRRIFNVEKLYFGPLHGSEVFTAPCIAPDRPLFELKGEAEIALRISQKSTSVLIDDGAQISATPTTGLFDAWCVALELPSSPIGNLLEAGVAALIADRCASGALILGPAYPLAAGTAKSWQGALLHIEQEGKIIAKGSVDALVEAPDICARNFLKQALEHGFTPKPGQWISTGGLTPCVALTGGTQLGLFYNDKQVFSFTLKDKTA